MICMCKHVVRTKLHNVYKVPSRVSFTQLPPSPTTRKEIEEYDWAVCIQYFWCKSIGDPGRIS